MRFSNILWGLVFIFLGLIIGLNAFGITNINLLFTGWWTLFLIIPSLIGLITEKEKTFNLIMLIVGIFLFLGVRDIIDFSILWKLMLPLILVLIGISLLFKDGVKKQLKKEIKETSDKDLKEYVATFSGETYDFSKEEFNDAKVSAIFGSIKCDLRNAKLKKETTIKIEAIFGGVVILVPADVTIKVVSTSIFGSVVGKKKMQNESKKILYLEATCLFGGVDIK